MSDNMITLTGNTTRDPELRYTPSRRPVAVFGLAVDRRYQVNGDWTEQTSFFDVVAWGTLGENVAASLRKGDRIVVTGRLEQRHWDGDDGTRRSKHEVIASDIGASLHWAQAAITKTTRADQAPHPADTEPSNEPF